MEPLSADERREWIGGFKGLSISSDAYFPFRDNLDRADRSGVQFVVQAGGSIRDDSVIGAANQYGMTMVMSGMRWFLH